MAGGLKGLGKKKLSALELPLLRELVDRIGGTSSDEDSVETLVKQLLKKKRNKKISPAEEQDSSLPPVQLVDEKAEFQSPSLERPIARRPDPSPTISPPVGSRVFKDKHTVTVIAFNALKLRLDQEELQDHFEQLAARFAEADIVMISEVSCGSQKTAGRASAFKSMLSSNGSEWSMAVSEPSGPGNLETHVVLVKAPISVIRYVTTSAADGVALDHAPLSVLVEDTRLGNFGSMVLTSVHFPPESRAKHRDSQIASFLRCYRTESTMRCETPFTLSGAKDARAKLPVHIVGGDFNAWIGDKKYSAVTSEYETVFGAHVATTSGNKAFDNFLLSSHARDYFTVSCKVLELETSQNSHKCRKGLSDHSPILLTLER